jgi:hypothetical protein
VGEPGCRPHDTLARIPIHADANGFDHTGAVSQRYPVHGVGRIKADHGIVVKIQRAAVDTNLDFSSRRGRRLRQIDQFQALKGAATSEFHGFHGFHGYQHKQVDANALPPAWVMLRPTSAH